MSQVAGKVTVVTSAGSGIGRTLAIALAAGGCELLCVECSWVCVRVFELVL